MHRTYAERFGDAWVVLSAKYGFLRPDDLVPRPYDVTFKRRSSGPIDPASLRRQVHELGLDHFDQVIALGGRSYRAHVKEAFATTGVRLQFPFAGCHSDWRSAPPTRPCPPGDRSDEHPGLPAWHDQACTGRLRHRHGSGVPGHGRVGRNLRSELV